MFYIFYTPNWWELSKLIISFPLFVFLFRENLEGHYFCTNVALCTSVCPYAKLQDNHGNEINMGIIICDMWWEMKKIALLWKFDGGTEIKKTLWNTVEMQAIVPATLASKQESKGNIERKDKELILPTRIDANISSTHCVWWIKNMKPYQQEKTGSSIQM